MKPSLFPHRFARPGWIAAASLASALALGFLAGCEETQAQTTPSPGELINGDFEQWSGGMPAGWIQQDHLKGRGELAAGSAAASGSRSLKLAPNSRNSNENDPYGVAQEILVGDWAGRRIEVEAAMRVVGGAQGAVVLLPRTRSKQVQGMKILWQRNSSSGFENQRIALDLASDIHSLIIACATPSKSGEVWFDAIRVGPDGSLTAKPPVSAGSGSGGSTQQSGVALYENGFDDWSGDTPSGWIQEKHLRDRGRMEADRSGGYSGTALKLTPNSRNNNSNQPYGVATLAPAAPLRGKTLRLEARMKRQGDAVPVMLFLSRAKGGKVLKSTYVSTDSSPGGYELRSAQVEIPPNAHDYVLGLVVNGTSGSVWFDDVRLVEGGTGTQPAPAPAAPTAPSSSTVTMSIDAGKTLHDIPKGLYGYNLGWVWWGEGAWDMEKDDFNQAVLDAIRRLNPGPIRYPQGTYVDFYHWRDGIGPRDRRPVRPHGTDANKSKMVFGTDEFMELCRRTGAEPMLQVNIMSGTPEEAADWVAYCNRPNHPERAANGSSQPYNVKLWEIGNEQYMRVENRRLKHTELTPQEYVKRFRAFAAAMKAVDPTIELGAIGGKDFERYQIVKHDDWNDVVLKELANDIDFYAVHNAYGPVLASQSGASLREIYAALVAFPEQIEQNLNDIARQIERYAGSRAKEIPIAVTEWGPLFHVLPNDPYVDHPKTLGSALFVATAMQKFIESPQTGIANFFKLTEHAWMSAIASENGAIKPSGYALQMFTDNFGDRLVDADVSSPTFDTRTVGNVAGVRGAPYVSSIASLSDDGSRLYVMAVNKNFDGPMNLEMEISGFDPRSTAKVVTLTGPALDAHNGDDLPDVPGLEWAEQARAPNSAWDRGKPDFVSPRTSSVRNADKKMTVSLPAMSIVSIELIRK